MLINWAESWLNQQVMIDLWKAEQHRGNLKVKSLIASSCLSEVKNPNV